MAIHVLAPDRQCNYDAYPLPSSQIAVLILTPVHAFISERHRHSHPHPCSHPEICFDSGVYPCPYIRNHFGSHAYRSPRSRRTVRLSRPSMLLSQKPTLTLTPIHARAPELSRSSMLSSQRARLSLTPIHALMSAGQIDAHAHPCPRVLCPLPLSTCRQG